VHRATLDHLQGVDSNLSYIPVMKIVLAATMLTVSLGGVAVPADASASVFGVADSPAWMGWSTGGFASDPPPPPPDWCTPDNPDPACHPPPPPQHYHRGHGIIVGP
jgi:hypothetical protein